VPSRVPRTVLAALAVALLSGCAGAPGPAALSSTATPSAVPSSAVPSSDVPSSVQSTAAEGAPRDLPARAAKRPATPAYQPHTVNELLNWVFAGMQLGRSYHFVTTTPAGTVAGVATWKDHIGGMVDMRGVKGWDQRRVIILGGDTYLLQEPPLDGKRWLKLSSASADPAVQQLAPLRYELDDLADPIPGWGWLGPIPVTKGGRVKLDGVWTTAYTFRQNNQELVAGSSAPSDWDAMRQRLAGATATSTYYVDAQGVPRKIVITVVRDGHSRVTTHLLRQWGQPVSIYLPKPVEVTERVPEGLRSA